MNQYHHLERDLDYGDKHRNKNDNKHHVFGENAANRLRKRLEKITIAPQHDEDYENITEDIQSLVREFNRRGKK